MRVGLRVAGFSPGARARATQDDSTSRLAYPSTSVTRETHLCVPGRSAACAEKLAYGIESPERASQGPSPNYA